MEYGLVCALIALGVIGGLEKTGTKLEKGLGEVSETLTPGAGPPGKGKKPGKPGKAA